MLVYSIKKANRQEIYQHLQGVNKLFVPSLEERVDIADFSDKIFNNTITFEAWDNENLIGLLSVYFNNTIDYYAFINNVSTEKKYANSDIATSLMNSCIEYGQNNNFKIIGLEVSTQNLIAIKLYEKFGFQVIEELNGFFKMEKKLHGEKNAKARLQ